MHGFRVGRTHQSSTCTTPATGHQTTATATNRLGGRIVGFIPPRRTTPQSGPGLAPLLPIPSNYVPVPPGVGQMAPIQRRAPCRFPGIALNAAVSGVMTGENTVPPTPGINEGNTSETQGNISLPITETPPNAS